MSKSKYKDSFICYDEWADNCEILTNEEFGFLMRAVFEYKKTGKEPDISDRTLIACWKPIKQAFDRTSRAYQELCETNRENGKKGGRPKKETFEEKPKKPNGFSENPPVPVPVPVPVREREPVRGRGRVPEEDTPPADTTTTTDLKKEIVDTWNSHSFVQKIKRVDNPQKRWERTEIAIELAGGKSHFLRLLQTLDEHAYLKDQPKSGYTVMYDWFIDPENFQNVLEGKYKNTRSKFGDGWEVVEFG